MNLEHYQGKTALQAFSPVMGVVNSCRSIVENLALGVTGVSGVLLPPVVLVIGFLILLALTARWFSAIQCSIRW